MNTSVTTEAHKQQVSALFSSLKANGQDAEEAPKPEAETKAEAPKASKVPNPAPKKPAVKSKLKAVDPKAAEPSKPKILIFGKPGVGKTWTSLDFPACYYIDTEGGADLAHYTDKLKKSGGVYLGVDQGSLSLKEIIGQIQALATEKHAYKTLVIDSISNVFNHEIAREAERLGDSNAFGADKKPAVSLMRQLVGWITRLDMNVILIAHEKTEWGMVENEKGKKERQEVGSTFDCWDRLAYLLHLSLEITKTGPQRLARVKKTRLRGFPEGEAFLWSYTEFATRYGKDIMEKESKVLVLATPEQLFALNTLIKETETPQKTVDAWLAKADVEGLEEMDGDKVEKLIAMLKSKMPTKGE